MEKRTIDVKLGDFEKTGVEAPARWSDSAISISARIYMTAQERSIFDLVDRVVNAISSKGVELGYFRDEVEVLSFRDDLRTILLNQDASFNTPVWCNIGVPGRTQQAWACLILDVDDNMESIQEGWRIESETFQGGSGSGVNVSKIRASGEPISDGSGVGSGPISLWMRPTDSIAGVVKSGGRTRRAAKMVIMDADHPEVAEFVQLKARAERVARTLKENGYDLSMTGADNDFIPFQNANNSVRATDLFMRKALGQDEESWSLTNRLDGQTRKVVSAVSLFQDIAQAAWECGDPGMQFHDTINAWNPVKNDGEITASNPCSEYMFLNNTVCNLASINLYNFRKDDLTFDYKRLEHVAEVMTVAMDILVDLSSYPTELIGETSKRYRNIGLGFTNLGALLMSFGIPYDSDPGRSFAAKIMSCIQASAIRTSQELAFHLGAYPAYGENAEHQERVLAQHKDVARDAGSGSFWVGINTKVPVRNAQFSVIAPTGTISLMMDCESTGIEPVLAIEATKNLVGGGSLKLGSQRCVSDAHAVPGGVTPDVFQTALGDNVVSPEGHVRMMAAVQPFVSGAISKTVNLPNNATVEDVMEIYELAFKTGCKAIAIYRDGCKAFQPHEVEKAPEVTQSVPEVASSRRRPSATRHGVTHKFTLSEQEYYVTINFYDDGTPCELFVKNNKHGSMAGGWADAFSIAVSLGLQYGVPFEKFVEHFRRMNFAPQGFVQSDSPIKMADSPVDYIFRWADEYLEPVVATSVAVLEYDGLPPKNATPGDRRVPEVREFTGTQCPICGGSNTGRTGTCETCFDCGESIGGCA